MVIGGCGGDGNATKNRTTTEPDTNTPTQEITRKQVLRALKVELRRRGLVADESGNVTFPDELTNLGSNQALAGDYTCNVFEHDSPDVAALKDSGSDVERIEGTDWSIVCGVVEIKSASLVQERVSAAVAATERGVERQMNS